VFLHGWIVNYRRAITVKIYTQKSNCIMSVVCKHCKKSYTKSHTCLAGQCTLCFSNFKNLRLHRCPVDKILTMNVRDEVQKLDIITCEACQRQFSSSKRIRLWKSIQLCVDCYRIPQIQCEIWHTRQTLNHYYVTKGFVNCRMCQGSIIDPTSGYVLQAFEADHIIPQDKHMSIGTMIRQGYSLHNIIQELSKCRLLCIRCHDIVTFAQQKSSVLHLKYVEQLSPEIRRRMRTIICKLENALFMKINP